MLKRNRYTNEMYKLIYKIYWTGHKKHIRYLLDHYGAQVINDLQSLFNQYRANIFFDMGTLLGFVREGKLLDHDLDIDIGIVVENEEMKSNFKEFLIKNGCTIKAQYYINEIGIVEETYIRNRIAFDVCYYTNRKDKSVCFLMYRRPGKEYSLNVYEVVELHSSQITGIEKKYVYNIEVSIPNNPEEYLKNRYGNDWMTPNINYIYWKGPSAICTDYVGKGIFAESMPIEE